MILPTKPLFPHCILGPHLPNAYILLGIAASANPKPLSNGQDRIWIGELVAL